MFTTENNRLALGLNTGYTLDSVEIKTSKTGTKYLSFTYGKSGASISKSFFEPKKDGNEEKYSRSCEIRSAQITSLLMIYPKFSTIKINPERNPNFTWEMFITAIVKAATELIIPDKTLVDLYVIEGRERDNGDRFLELPDAINRGKDKFVKLSTDTTPLDLTDYLENQKKREAKATPKAADINTLPF